MSQEKEISAAGKQEDVQNQNDLQVEKEPLGSMAFDPSEEKQALIEPNSNILIVNTDYYKSGNSLITDIFNSRPTGLFQVLIVFTLGMYIFILGGINLVGTLVPVILQSEWFLEEYQLSLLYTSIQGGVSAGSFAAGPISDNFGRKGALICAGIIALIFGILASFSGNYYTLLGTMVLMSFGVGISEIVVTSFAVETCNAKHRGIILLLIQGAFFSAGEIYCTQIALWTTPRLFAGENWRSLIRLTIIPIIICVVLIFYFPESPVWLATQKRPEETI